MLDDMPICQIRYLLASEKEPRTACLSVEGIPEPDVAIGHLSLSLVRRDEVFRLELQALQPLSVLGSEVMFHHTFTPDQKVFLNGYQSWTDSRELPPASRMRGLSHVPRWLVDRFVLDGSGDYRFTEYPDEPGKLHGFGYGYLRRDLAVTLVASLSEDSAFTLMRTDAKAGTWTLLPERPPSPLAAGSECTLCVFAVLQGDRTQVFDRWFQLLDRAARPAHPLVGYTSWYRHYGDIDADKLLHDLAGVADHLSTLDLSGLTPLFQIDDGYAKVGDWLEPDPIRFPKGLSVLADRIAACGLTPGLWLAPFVCEKDSRLYAEHPDWLLRYASGALATTGCNWSGAVALDTRNPAVRDYVAQVIRTVTAEWGFKLLKLDFLFAACMDPHDGMTRGQLMADGMDLLRRAAAEGTSFLSCGVPLPSVFGRTEYCRVGCDVGLDWDDRPYMRLIHRERISTRNNRDNTLGRAHLDGRAFRNDPDVFFLRDDVKLSEEQRLTQLRIDAKLGGVLLTSDDMATWSEPDCEAYLEAVDTLRRSDPYAAR